MTRKRGGVARSGSTRAVSSSSPASGNTAPIQFSIRVFEPLRFAAGTGSIEPSKEHGDVELHALGPCALDRTGKRLELIESSCKLASIEPATERFHKRYQRSRGRVQSRLPSWCGLDYVPYLRRLYLGAPIQ